jgi:ribosomal subunit interface protein
VSLPFSPFKEEERMDITINARHCKVPESLRNQASQRLSRLTRIDRRLTAATLVFEVENMERRVEARVAVAGGPPIIGNGTGPTLRGALDAALTRVERQIKRRRERFVARRSRVGVAVDGDLVA